MTTNEKRLKKSSQNLLFGVCGGIAEYFGIDPTWVRVGWVILVLFAGTGLLLYVILALVMPKAE